LEIIRKNKVQTASGAVITVCTFGLTDYTQAYQAMLDYTNQRGQEPSANDDQIWLIQPPPVYTQGTACNQKTFSPSDIAVVKTDRGGQITYHGPGQIVMYPLLHLKAHGLGVKALVSKLEQAVIGLLATLNITAERREDAPGVYVDQAKIAALGLRIRRGNSYHGLSFNVDMDLSPFQDIDPCGYQGLQVTQLLDWRPSMKPNFDELGRSLVEHFVRLL